MRHIPYWVLWVIVLVAVLLSPIMSLTVLFFAFELLWGLTDAAGLPTLFAGACLIIAAAMLERRLRRSSAAIGRRSDRVRDPAPQAAAAPFKGSEGAALGG